MSTLNKELVLLILQYFDEEGLKEVAHELERQTGFYFDTKFFEDMIVGGNWEGAERYLSGFTVLDDNKYSTKIYFLIRKQNFFEALDKNERARAIDILMKDLKVFDSENSEIFKELTQLLTLNNIRDHDSLSWYGDAESGRKLLMQELKTLIEANPLFHDKLKFPSIKSQRLRRLINQSLNWQHVQCAYPRENPEIETLFTDHVCSPPSDDQFSTPSGTMPSQTTSTHVTNSTDSVKSTPCPSIVNNSEIFDGVICLPHAINQDGLKSNSETSYKVSFENIDEEISSLLHLNEPEHLPAVNVPAQSCSDVLHKCPPTPLSNKPESDGFPELFAKTLNEESSPTSMDFHPIRQTVLLVGTSTGGIGLWEVSSGEKLLSKNFNVWEIGACSTLFKTTLVRDSCISVNRVTWSPEGSLFGVAYSKHLVQIYSYHGGNNMKQQLEIEAHVGGVNDLAFSAPQNQLLIITCGDDKTIKAWDATTGVKVYTFEGHNTPVYSICAHSKSDIHYIFSTSVDGKIKVWLYDNIGARVDYDAPGFGCTSMAYSADRRLFSCGTNESGESFLVEWDESEGSIKRIYQGLQNGSSYIVQFDIMKNQFLAAADEDLIKIWGMDEVELLKTIKVDGGIPAKACIRFNKDGSLLAVSANKNNIKILATNHDLKLSHTSEKSSADGSRILSNVFRKLSINPDSTAICGGFSGNVALKNDNEENLEVVNDNVSNRTKLLEINRPSQCKTLWLPSHVKAKKVSRLIYNNAGNAILALASNAIHLFWKWSHSELNSSGKATAEVPPQLWQPKNYHGLMTNDIIGIDPEEAVRCFALSKNDSYLISTSGGKISLFNLLSFKTMHSFLPSPPATTCLAFYPRDNNIIALGKDDSTILIYNARLSEVIFKLEGHSKRICSLAFSETLNVLVSAGADAQISVWNAEGWEKQFSRYVQIPDWEEPVKMLPCSYTRVQFYPNEKRFLAVQVRQLAIYEAEGLDCVKQWVPRNFAPISDATLSCDGLTVYASFMDGTISMFDALSLELQCQIMPLAYLPVDSRLDVYPLAIAAHPQKPNQFAVGLTDGNVVIFEPSNNSDKWLKLGPGDDGSESNLTLGHILTIESSSEYDVHDLKQHGLKYIENDS